MGTLNDWARSNSQFIRLNDKETLEVVFKEFKIVPNKFDTDKETVRYTFLVNGDEKYWENGTNNAATFFDNVKEGEVVSITRHGEGTKTKYDLELIPADVQKETKPLMEDGSPLEDLDLS